MNRTAARAAWYFGLILVLGLALRGYHLGAQDLWRDEEISVLIAAQSWRGILAEMPLVSQPPLFYWLLHLWLPLRGHDTWSLHLLPALLGLACLPYVYLLGRAWFDEATGRWAMFWLAIAPMHVYYSQELRMYTLLPLLSLMLAWYWHQLCAGRRGAWVGYLLAAVLLLYTHYWGLVFFLAVNVLYWLHPATARPPLRSWLALQALALASLIPWLPYFLAQVHYTHGYLAKPTTFAAAITLFNFLLGRMPHEMAFADFLYHSPYELLVLVLAILVLLPGLVAVRRSARYWHFAFPRTVAHRALLGLPFLPLLVAFLVSLQYSISHQRYTIVVLPFLCLLLARGLQRSNPYLRGGVALILAATWLSHLNLYFTTFTKSRDRQMVQIINRGARPGDVLLTTNWGAIPFAFYGVQARGLVQFGYPRATYQGAIFEGDQLDYDPQQRTRQTLQGIRQAMAHGSGRLWLLRTYNKTSLVRDRELYQTLRRTLTILQEHAFLEGEVLLFQQPAAR